MATQPNKPNHSAASLAAAVEEASEDLFSSEHLDALAKRVSKHPELGEAPQELVEKAMQRAIDQHRKGYKKLHPSEYAHYNDMFAKDGVSAVEKAYKKLAAGAEPTDSTFARPGLRNHRTNGLSNLNGLSSDQKIYGGMALLMAGLSAVGAYSNFKHASTTDEHGKHHWQASQIGMGLISLTLAAGMAYAGLQTLRAR